MKRTLLAAALGLLAAFPAQAITLSVQPANTAAQVGDSFSVDLLISGLDAGVAPSLASFDLDLGFDAALLAFQSASFGTGLDVLGLGSVSGTTLSAGALNLFEISLDSATDLNDLQGDSFVLASVTFQALAAGLSNLSLNVNALADADANALVASVQDGAVTLAAVPEPATLGLLLPGLWLLSRGRAAPAR